MKAGKFWEPAPAGAAPPYTAVSVGSHGWGDRLLGLARQAGLEGLFGTRGEAQQGRQIDVVIGAPGKNGGGKSSLAAVGSGRSQRKNEMGSPGLGVECCAGCIATRQWMIQSTGRASSSRASSAASTDAGAIAAGAAIRF